MNPAGGPRDPEPRSTRMRLLPPTPLLLPLLLLALGAGMALYAWIALGDAGAFGAGFMPAAIGCLIVLLSLLELAREARRHAAPRQPPATAPAAARQLFGLAVVAAAVVFYIACVDALGFVATASLIVVALLAPCLPRRRLLASLAAVAAVAAIGYLFSAILLVPLPSGSLF